MSKKTQKRKAERRARQQARQLTVGVPGLRSFWIQGGVIVGLYLLAYPFLMSEFRAARYRDGKE